MLAAGITTGIMDSTGFGDVAKRAKDGGVAGRNQAIFERVVLRTAVNTAIKGGSLRDNFKGEALRGVLAVGQGYIGDIGQRYGLSEGGAAKIAMHSALGGTYALASGGNVAVGMLAGGMGEALSGISSSIGHSPGHEFSGTGESGTGLSNWNDTIVATSTMLAGGSASDISMATTVSSSVTEYNEQLHPRETELLKEKIDNTTSKEEKILWAAAALSIKHGDEGIPVKKDEYRALIEELVKLGGSDIANPYREQLITLGKEKGWGSYLEGTWLERGVNEVIALESGGLAPVESYVRYSKPFEHTLAHDIENTVSRQDRIINELIGIFKMGSGAARVVASTALAPIPFVGTPIAITTGTLSGLHAYNGYEQVFGEYKSSVGANVLDSLGTSVPSYLEVKNKELASEAVFFGGAKLVGAGVGAAWKNASHIVNKLTDTKPNGINIANASDLKITVADIITGKTAKKVAEIKAVNEHFFRQNKNVLDEISNTIQKLQKQNKKDIIGSFANDNNRLKKFELINTSVTERWGINSVSTVKDKIIAKPFIIKRYIREVERIINKGIGGKQLTLLKEVLQRQEFKKLDKVAKLEHRRKFDNMKKNLIKEWEINTGKKWPKYEQDVGNRKAGDLYDAHHLIQVSHGGPNTWWNIHPATKIEHQEIHGIGSTIKEIFGK